MGAAATLHPCSHASSRGPAYKRRRPEKTLLHHLVRCHLETMLEQGRLRSEYGTGYPRYVEQTFRRYLACGLPSEGLARVRCASCGSERLVAFSCKLRGVCPSCSARRMEQTALVLSAKLLPKLPYRQSDS